MLFSVLVIVLLLVELLRRLGAYLALLYYLESKSIAYLTQDLHQKNLADPGMHSDMGQLIFNLKRNNTDNLLRLKKMLKIPYLTAF